MLLHVRNASFFSFYSTSTLKDKTILYAFEDNSHISPIFSSPSKTLLHLSTVFVFMLPAFISQLRSSGWASDVAPLWKYDAQNILRQHMSKEYPVQWIHQLPHSVPFTLLNAALNHTGLFGNHSTLLTHSEIMPTIIPKGFLTVYFYKPMSFLTCILTVFFLSKCRLLQLHPLSLIWCSLLRLFWFLIL